MCWLQWCCLFCNCTNLFKIRNLIFIWMKIVHIGIFFEKSSTHFFIVFQSKKILLLPRCWCKMAWSANEQKVFELFLPSNNKVFSLTKLQKKSYLTFLYVVLSLVQHFPNKMHFKCSIYNINYIGQWRGLINYKLSKVFLITNV